MRTLLLRALALLVALTTISACTQTSPAPELTGGPLPLVHLPTGYTPPVTRPNLLVIEADDMRVDDLQFMPNVRHLLLDRGEIFLNSFAPYPLCCPSRVSFLDGKYTHNTGVYGVKFPYGFHAFHDGDTIATRLQAAGYQTALVGKYLNGYADTTTVDDKPSEHYVPPGWTYWRGSSDHLYPMGSPYKGNTYNYFAMTQIDGHGRIIPHKGVYSTDLTGHEVRRVITGFGKDRATSGKPWFTWWTPVAPHFGGPFESDDPGAVRMDTGRLEHFQTPARPAWVKGMFDHRITHGLGQPVAGPAEADNSDKPTYIRSLPEQNLAERVAETNLTRQRAEALYVLDQEVGLTLRRLKQTGQYDDTIVMFTSDNGYYLGEHRRRQGKITVHEPSLRVPLIIAGPGIHHGVRYDPITTVDIAPTLASYAGGLPPHRTDGVNMRPVIEGRDRGWIRPVVTEGKMDGIYLQHSKPGFESPLNERGIRLARWKLVNYADGEAELYDLARDPLELQNLAGDPHYRGLMARMQAIWLRYYGCRGRACSRPLPRWAQATPAQEAAITRHQLEATATYYSDPGWLDGVPRD